eukprot:CAMPEP_0174877760 /NCGR_PEP_ID=MMETSP1114-20130205/82417_1 /TAXON_ID=312471 /ORGANISM="Neobodo designis, Strain CCAP 1951/1" /LENGTH=212 /DNA_ID=CAMNT_0016113145 /DNA_START=90 /DNA_END=728 /DNA_ORIENTATION=+
MGCASSNSTVNDAHDAMPLPSQYAAPPSPTSTPRTVHPDRALEAASHPSLLPTPGLSSTPGGGGGEACSVDMSAEVLSNATSDGVVTSEPDRAATAKRWCQVLSTACANGGGVTADDDGAAVAADTLSAARRLDISRWLADTSLHLSFFFESTAALPHIPPHNEQPGDAHPSPPPPPPLSAIPRRLSSITLACHTRVMRQRHDGYLMAQSAD